MLNKKFMKKSLSMLMALTLSVTLASCTQKNDNKDDTDKNASTSTEEKKDEQKSEANGQTFEGEGTGNNGKIVVEVSLDGEKISGVNIKEHNETPNISDKAIEEIPKAIVDNQSVEIDSISGATNTSNGIKEAVAAALAKANLDIKNYQKKVSLGEEARDIKDGTYDVVVLGAGGAGLSAAIEAKNNGADKVVVVEKTAHAGGNTLLSYAELACANNWLQKEKGIEDSNEKFLKEMWEGGGKVARKEMVKTVVDHALEAAEWLRDYVGVKYQDYLVHEGGHSVPRAVEPIEKGPGMIEPLVKKAEELGVEIHYNTKAEELVKDKDRVTGVVVSSGDKKATYTANNGVILATGGFGANVKMRDHYNKRWKTLDDSVLTTNAPSIQGDGIVMAEKIGAKLENMEHIQLYPFNNPKTGVFYGIEAPSWSSEGLIYVNKDGKRFVNEMSMRDNRAEAILAQGGLVYAIYNQEVADRLKLEEQFKSEYEKCLKDGVFFKADTLKEVADHFGINAKNLEETMNNYNKYMEEGKDPEFGRTEAMVPMHKGPWFILEGVVSVHHTMGGVAIDENAHALDNNGKVIPGLYAAGEVTGSVHGNNRVGTCAISDIVVFGRIAGKNAAIKE